MTRRRDVCVWNATSFPLRRLQFLHSVALSMVVIAHKFRPDGYHLFLPPPFIPPSIQGSSLLTSPSPVYSCSCRCTWVRSCIFGNLKSSLKPKIQLTRNANILLFFTTAAALIMLIQGAI